MNQVYSGWKIPIILLAWQRIDSTSDDCSIGLRKLWSDVKKTHTLNCIGRGRKRRQPLGRALRRVFAVGSDILIVMGPKTIKSARAASAGSPDEYDVRV